MSDTPRTDAVDRARETESNFLHYRAIVKHAQQLERELTEMTVLRDFEQIYASHYKQKRDEAQKEDEK